MVKKIFKKQEKQEEAEAKAKAEEEKKKEIEDLKNKLLNEMNSDKKWAIVVNQLNPYW